MSDLISRQDAIDAVIKKLGIKSGEFFLPAEKAILEVLRTMPSAEPDLDEHSVWFRIGETLVDVSKSHISAEEGIQKIRDYLIMMKKPEKKIKRHQFNFSDLEAEPEQKGKLIEEINKMDKLYLDTQDRKIRVLPYDNVISIIQRTEPEQKMGKWIGRELGYCSVCGHEGCASDIWDRCKEMFCPNCGAKMEGENDEID